MQRTIGVFTMSEKLDTIPCKERKGWRRRRRRRRRRL